jgi:hypothetical protein
VFSIYQSTLTSKSNNHINSSSILKSQQLLQPSMLVIDYNKIISKGE